MDVAVSILIICGLGSKPADIVRMHIINRTLTLNELQTNNSMLTVKELHII